MDEWEKVTHIHNPLHLLRLCIEVFCCQTSVLTSLHHSRPAIEIEIEHIVDTFFYRNRISMARTKEFILFHS